VIARLEDVLRHQRDAVTSLDGCLHEVDRRLASGDTAGLRAALVEARAAADRASALELTRCLALVAEGLSPDLTVEEIAEALVPRVGDHVVALADDLRAAVTRANDHRQRILTAVASGPTDLPPVDLGRPLRV
jgi:hypothetical protein